MICAPWTDADAVKACCGNLGIDGVDEVIQEAIDVASEHLFLRSGRQYPGESSTTIRPGGDPCRLWRDIETDPSTWCSCDRESKLDLGYSSITEITSVVIDGETLDPSEYELVDGRFLQRMAGAGPEYRNEGWPTHQHLDRPLIEPGTWSVSFVYGAVPPSAGIRAATALACELARAYSRSPECQLPGRVSSVTRQGVTMTLIDTSALAEGMTGVYEADLFLTSVNPTKARGGTLVWSPDLDPAV